MSTDRRPTSRENRKLATPSSSPPVPARKVEVQSSVKPGEVPLASEIEVVPFSPDGPQVAGNSCPILYPHAPHDQCDGRQGHRLAIPPKGGSSPPNRIEQIQSGQRSAEAVTANLNEAIKGSGKHKTARAPEENAPKGGSSTAAKIHNPAERWPNGTVIIAMYAAEPAPMWTVSATYATGGTSLWAYNSSLERAYRELWRMYQERRKTAE
jgi:hypothetical protein